MFENKIKVISNISNYNDFNVNDSTARYGTLINEMRDSVLIVNYTIDKQKAVQETTTSK